MNSPSPSIQPVTVRTLLCHRDVGLLLDNWRTLVTCCADPITLVVHDDGSLTAEDAAALHAAFPGVRVVRRADADARMEDLLARHPHARTFRSSVWGLKLLDVVLAEPGDCFYVDADIRFLRPFRGLFCAEAVRDRSVFLRDTVWTAYSVRPWHLIGRGRLALVEAINTGLTLIDHKRFDLDFVEWFLAQPDWRVIPSWTEPTCWAALGARTNAHAIDPGQFANLYPGTRVGEAMIAVHLLSSFRGEFADVARAAPDQGRLAADVRLQPLARLGAIALGWNQLRRKLTNEIRRRRAAG